LFSVCPKKTKFPHVTDLFKNSTKIEYLKRFKLYAHYTHTLTHARALMIGII